MGDLQAVRPQTGSFLATYIHMYTHMYTHIHTQTEATKHIHVTLLHIRVQSKYINIYVLCCPQLQINPFLAHSCTCQTTYYNYHTNMKQYYLVTLKEAAVM